MKKRVTASKPNKRENAVAGSVFLAGGGEDRFGVAC